MNAVIEFDFGSDPAELLEQLVRIEESLGRKRDHRRNVSRNIDIDLLYCGNLKVDNERLQLPHSRMHLRRFVLKPLADIRPGLMLPGRTRTVRELLADLEEPGEVVCLTDDW